MTPQIIATSGPMWTLPNQDGQARRFYLDLHADGSATFRPYDETKWHVDQWPDCQPTPKGNPR